MRGKLNRETYGNIILGLIPAHAGKTPCAEPRGRESRAHPRACGENRHFRADARGSPGSSPRMRGKPALFLRIRPRDRLIPAHAGKTQHASQCQAPTRAHPRACGENGIAWIRPLISAGSSPRMRGKLVWCCGEVGAVGLIPAHAGKTNQD